MEDEDSVGGRWSYAAVGEDGGLEDGVAGKIERIWEFGTVGSRFASIGGVPDNCIRREVFGKRCLQTDACSASSLCLDNDAGCGKDRVWKYHPGNASAIGVIRGGREHVAHGFSTVADAAVSDVWSRHWL